MQEHHYARHLLLHRVRVRTPVFIIQPVVIVSDLTLLMWQIYGRLLCSLKRQREITSEAILSSANRNDATEQQKLLRKMPPVSLSEQSAGSLTRLIVWMTEQAGCIFSCEIVATVPFYSKSKAGGFFSVCSYYGLWMWFPELFERVEDGGSPCANVSLRSPLDNQSCYPVKTAGAFLGSQRVYCGFYCLFPHSLQPANNRLDMHHTFPAHP